MTYQELENMGWKTTAKDTYSFVSRTPGDDVWLELFCDNEKNYYQIMRASKEEKGQTIRKTISEGELKEEEFKLIIEKLFSVV